MSTFSSKGFKFTSVLLILLLSISAQAIVIRHDKADSRYRVNETDYPQIFFLHTRYGNKVCVATLISPQWAITAAHCTRQTPIADAHARNEDYPLMIAGKPYKIIDLVIHPNAEHSELNQAVDLALFKLDREVPEVEPVQLYVDSNELDLIVSLLGWGYTGIGTLGRQDNDGKLRRAKNTIAIAGQWLQFNFDDPRQQNSRSLPLEGVPGLGDSGGPALLEAEGGLHLVGVAVGEVADSAYVGAKQGRYGATEIYERISSHVDWINQVVSAK